jgi:hypothetical protein
VTEPKKRKPEGSGKTAGPKKTATPKLIRLDDLAPKKDVRGAGKTFFGGKPTNP